MERWTAAQLDRSRAPARQAPIETSTLSETPIADPWERAISRARSELRSLIESGELSHDEVTAGWVEAWAADNHDDERAAA